MGDRAVIATEKKDLGIYVHWCGSRSYVRPFLMYCKMRGFRPPEHDDYGWARLCQVIANAFGGDMSIGIGRYETMDTDNGDNGVYIIKDWKIVGREFGTDYQLGGYDPKEALLEINSQQPEKDRLDNAEMFELYDAMAKQGY